MGMIHPTLFSRSFNGRCYGNPPSFVALAFHTQLYLYFTTNVVAKKIPQRMGRLQNGSTRWHVRRWVDPSSYDKKLMKFGPVTPEFCSAFDKPHIYLGEWIGIFKPNAQNNILKLAYYRNYLVTDSNEFRHSGKLNPRNKFCGWVVQTRVKQIRDGGQPPFWKQLNR